MCAVYKHVYHGLTESNPEYTHSVQSGGREKYKRGSDRRSDETDIQRDEEKEKPGRQKPLQTGSQKDSQTDKMWKRTDQQMDMQGETDRQPTSHLGMYLFMMA